MRRLLETYKYYWKLFNSMAKYKKCECLVEEKSVARCDAVNKLKTGGGIFLCSKTRSQYHVTAMCWKVNAALSNTVL